MKVRIDAISKIGINPRQITKESPGIAELGASIKGNGQQIPIIINQPAERGLKYELIDGERRLEACKAIGLEEIEAIIYQGMTKEAMQSINALSNLHRRDLTVFEKSVEAEKLIKEIGKDETAAAVLGISKHELKMLANLKNLSAKWKKVLQGGGIYSLLSAKVLGMIARLPQNVQENRFSDIAHAVFNGNDNTPVPMKEFEKWLASEMRTVESFPFDTSACGKCQKRDIIQADLFPESKSDTGGKCLDSLCYQKKLHAFLIEKMKELKEQYGNKVGYTGYVGFDNPLSREAEPLRRCDGDNLKTGDPKDEKSFPVIHTEGVQAGKVTWHQKAKNVDLGEMDKPKKTAAETKERKIQIEKGKALVAAISELLKTGKANLKKELEKKIDLAQKIIFFFGTVGSCGAANAKQWENLLTAKKEKVNGVVVIKAMEILETRLNYYGRPGDIPFTDYYKEAEQVAKIIGVDFSAIYKKHEPKIEVSKKATAKPEPKKTA